MLVHLVVTAALALPCQQGSKELARESYPDGSPRLEREVKRDAQGNALPDGASREWHPNGQLAAEGRFARGLRQGSWTFWHAGGERSARGRFEDGARNGKWFFWTPDGAEDRERTGEYQLERIADPAGDLRALGYRLAGRRSGVWRFLWPDGRLQFTGRYRNGVREGAWVFFHSDGAVASLLLSGVYEGGHFAKQLSEGDLRAFEPGQEVGLDEAQRTPRADAATRAVAEQPWVVDWSERLAELEALDLADARVVAQLGERLPWVLGGFGREGFGWNREPTPEGLAARREFLRSLRSLWELKRCDEVYWLLDLRGDPVQADELLRAPPLLLEEHPTDAQSRESATYFAGRFRKRDARDPLSSEACQAAVRDALAWLADHQSPAGLWDADGYQANNALGPRSCRCEGIAQQGWDVGITSLALLAFLGAGHTPYRGEHAATVTRGLASLLDQQDPELGCFRTKWKREKTTYVQHAFIYEHALATMALAEAYALTGHASLRPRLQAATDFLHKARNPRGAWRYAYPPDGESDTSVTAWVVQALRAAEEAGLEVDPAAYGGALTWLDSVTDPSHGRCGYREMGSVSARLEELIQTFPSEKSEAMTAAALLTQFLSARGSSLKPIMEKQGDLLLFKLPTWNANDGSLDYIYWYFGSHALSQLGGPRWSTWCKALIPAVVERQRRDGNERGSWDPVDAWSVTGGRIYATAVLALTLESATRIGPCAPGSTRVPR